MKITNNNGNYDFEFKDLDPKAVKKFVLVAIAVILAVIIGSQSFYNVKEQKAPAHPYSYLIRSMFL